MIKLQMLKVTGNSMTPTLMPGVFVVIWRWRLLGHSQRLKMGDIVAVNHPIYGQIVKRVSQLRCDDQGRLIELCLQGDNEQASLSEEEMGWTAEQTVMGRVIYVVSAKA